jgi:hypothetical protein
MKEGKKETTSSLLITQNEQMPDNEQKDVEISPGISMPSYIFVINNIIIAIIYY